MPNDNDDYLIDSTLDFSRLWDNSANTFNTFQSLTTATYGQSEEVVGCDCIMCAQSRNTLDSTDSLAETSFIEENPMPNNLTSIQRSELEYSLNDILFKLNEINRNRGWAFSRVNDSIKMDGFQITITPEFARAPGVSTPINSSRINRFHLKFDVPQEYRRIGNRYSFYYRARNFVDEDISYKIVDFLISYGSVLGDPIQETITDEEADVIRIKTQERNKRMDELKEKAQKTYERFMDLLSNNGEAKIESTKEDDIINVSLPNNVKFRLNIYGDNVTLRDIDLPVNFNAEKTEDFISIFNKLKSI